MIELTAREKKLLGVIRMFNLSKDEALDIKALARKAYPQIRPFVRADRTVRNSVRRLLKWGYVKRADEGIYIFKTAK